MGDLHVCPKTVDKVRDRGEVGGPVVRPQQSCRHAGGLRLCALDLDTSGRRKGRTRVAPDVAEVGRGSNPGLPARERGGAVRCL